MPKNREKRCKKVTDFPHLAKKLKKEEEDLDEMSQIFSEMSHNIRQIDLDVGKPTKLMENLDKLSEEYRRQKQNPLRSEVESQTLDEKMPYIQEKVKDVLQQCKNVEKHCEEMIQENNELQQKLLEYQNRLLEEKELEITPEDLREWLQTFEKNCQDLNERLEEYREYEEEISEHIDEVLQDL
ncbi:UNVERIFIED_CONTAM: hypothetical protein RMT77_018822 [Armadillidium vulgare]